MDTQYNQVMRIIEADCEIDYNGRGSTRRGRGVRLLILKDDDSFLIHKSVGVKPINYMTKVVTVEESSSPDGTSMLTVASKTESIDVIIYKRLLDMTIDMDADDTKTITNGTERQFQEWLSRRENWVHWFGKDTRFLTRELKTANGSCDLAGLDVKTGKLMLIEMKRRANRKDVYQVERYREAIIKDISEHGFNWFIEGLLLQTDDDDCRRMISDLDESSFTEPECWLVGERSASDDVEPFCEEHGIRFLVTGSDWWGETAPLETAAKTAKPSNGHKSKSTGTNDALLPII